MDDIGIDIDDDDIDDENDLRAVDSDDEELKNNGNGNININNNNNNINNGEEDVERDDDVDIGFRSHNFQYGTYGKNRNRSRRQNQEEAIYGVFYESDNERGNTLGRNKRREGGGTVMGNAPVFVPASKPPEMPTEAAPIFVAATNKNDNENDNATEAAASPMLAAASAKQETNATSQGGLGFVKATTESSSAASSSASASSTRGLGFVAATANKNDDADDREAANDEEEERRIQKEQQEADDRFRELLEKAKARNKGSRPGGSNTTSSSATAAAATAAPSMGSGGLGMKPTSLPTSFGGGGGLGLGGGGDRPQPLRQKDPAVGTWEKHTKGFGSKLLAKMGWTGTGGLGSNRRRFRGQAASEDTGKETTQDSQGVSSPPPPPTAAAATNIAAAVNPTVSAAPVKKGISRPVEVVVRPANMGLGFGNFKEASQLKTNRRIEAEVRGIDFDAQIAKEKEEARQKRKRQRKQRYGDRYISSSEDEDDNDNDNDNDGPERNVQSSAIPSTEALLSKQSWKANRKRRKTKKSGLPEIIPYKELLERQKKQNGGQTTDAPVIIDMRGPQQSANSRLTAPGAGVPLGEELLYNLSFLLGTYGSKLNSSSHHYETSIQRTIKGLNAQIRDAEERFQKSTNRRTKLARAHEIAEDVRETLSTSSGSISSRDFGAKKERVGELVRELREVFTPEERRDLQFWEVLAPTLLGPIVQATLDTWKPFFGTSSNSNNNSIDPNDRSVVDSFFEWSSSGSDSNRKNNKSGEKSDDDESESRILCESMIRNQLIPKLRADIEAEVSPLWDPVTDPYAVLDLYEYLRTKALAFDMHMPIPKPSAIENENEKEHDIDDDNPNQIFPSSRDDEVDDDMGLQQSSSHLAEYIRKELIVDSLYPKLQSAISTWKPTLSPQTKDLQHPLHLWVLPWLPHIDHPALLPNLLGECKRRLRSSLSVLQRGIPSSFASASSHESNDRRYIVSVLNVLRPWHTVFDRKSFQTMVSDDRAFLPRLERLLTASSEAESSDWKDAGLLFELHGRHVISDVDFLSLLEGPVLTTWARKVHANLWESISSSRKYEPGVIDVAVKMYRDCKIHVMVDPFLGHKKSPSSISFSRSLKLLQSDEFICRMFYSVVRMIQIVKELLSLESSSESSELQIEELDRLEPDVHGFYTIRARRSLEEKQKIQEDFVTMESRSRGESMARIKLQRRNKNSEPTFREVVEAFANDRGVVFRPKQGASNKDGKQIYLFGNRSIYLEGDVAFCHDPTGGSWKPLSLDQLGGMVSA